MSKVNKMIFVPCVSVDSNGDICTAIKDKGNGNIIAANDVDEDYEELFLSLPEMQDRLSKQQEEIAELKSDLRFMLKMVDQIGYTTEQYERYLSILAQTQ